MNEEEAAPFLKEEDEQTNSVKPKELCSFERDYQHNRSSHQKKFQRDSEQNSSRRSERHKKRHDLNNDYTKYQYHRRSYRVSSLFQHAERYTKKRNEGGVVAGGDCTPINIKERLSCQQR